NKDQSYFLWTLTQKQLARCLFPIGEYTKPQVRVLAKKFGLLTATKKDSQGICFLGQVSIRDFLRQYIKPKKGEILTADGRVVGTHEGAHLYTIGQRHGFGVGGLAASHYVVAKDMKKNTITIAPENHPSLYKTEIKLKDVNFILQNYSLFTIHSSLPVLARVRYRQPLFPAILSFAHSRELGYKKNGEWRLVFQKPQKFVAEGQSAVFYVREGNPSRGSGCRSRELRMLGGGIIVA
ncbi:MAG: hypothetical protein HYZ07_00430, partial [Candidatus Harrisonbacteria bacterium]|nr:hypothetical protein [Candidatus Harrisonbacteria bacterium]